MRSRMFLFGGIFVGMVALSVAEAWSSERETESVKVEQFTYKETDQADLKIYVHYPPDWSQDDERPAIVFFFGGGWRSGNVGQFRDQADYLASRGMVSARADYRVKSRHDVLPDACVQDAKSAVRWLRQNTGKLGIDADRIVASGGSAGGHIAACTSLTSGLEAENEDASISSHPNTLVLFNPVLRLDVPRLLSRLNNDEQLAKQISPTLHIQKTTPPALLLYGTSDRLMEQGREFVEKSKQTGNRAEIYSAEGQGHGFFNRSPWKERTLYRTDEFLQSLDYLKGKPTIELPEEES